MWECGEENNLICRLYGILGGYRCIEFKNTGTLNKATFKLLKDTDVSHHQNATVMHDLCESFRIMIMVLLIGRYLCLTIITQVHVHKINIDHKAWSVIGTTNEHRGKS